MQNDIQFLKLEVLNVIADDVDLYNLGLVGLIGFSKSLAPRAFS